MFTSPTCYVTIGGKIIPQDDILFFEFITDETQPLPLAHLGISDIRGQLLSTFYGLSIGSSVDITITDREVDASQTELMKYDFYKMSIVSISGSFTDIVTGSNTLELLLSHPWAISQDSDPHAYKGKTNSTLIKDILNDSNGRPFKFNDILDSAWEESDDNGSYPRYKCNESDLDFIINKILPYTTINNSPPLFWIDQDGNPNLRSFNSLYSQAPKAVVLSSNVAQSMDDPAIKNYIQQYNPIFADEATITIGDESPMPVIRELKSKATFDDNANGVSYTGIYPIKIAIGKDTGDNLNSGKLPINKELIYRTKTTDYKTFINRRVEDQEALALNSQKILYDLFDFNIECNFCADYIKPGDNIIFRIKPVENNEIHWLTGTWHVKSITHHLVTKNDTRTLKSLLTVCRPSFSFDERTTTLVDTDNLYGVV